LPMSNLPLPFSEPAYKRKEKDRLEVHNRMRERGTFDICAALFPTR
jgi:hypothetical protein